MAIEALHGKANPLELMFSWAKTKTQIIGGFLFTCVARILKTWKALHIFVGCCIAAGDHAMTS